MNRVEGRCQSTRSRLLQTEIHAIQSYRAALTLDVLTIAAAFLFTLIPSTSAGTSATVRTGVLDEPA